LTVSPKQGCAWFVKLSAGKSSTAVVIVRSGEVILVDPCQSQSPQQPIGNRNAIRVMPFARSWGFTSKVWAQVQMK
jgi:hypothetical protein